MTNEVVIRDAAAGRRVRFSEPLQVIQANRIEEVVPKLRLVEKAVEGGGLWAAGFISYEAAPAFDAALKVRPVGCFPLLWFGVYAQPGAMESWPGPMGSPYTLGKWAPSVSRVEYDQAVAQIKGHIAGGETYQLNYTFRLRAPFSGDARAFFVDLARAQEAEYAAYVDTGRFAICSASPELFFRLDGGRLVSRPMKGTAGRGRTLSEDNARAEWLFHSAKNRAENIMIVDMMRNDMGRIAAIGSVEVPRVFDVERYPTVWQMTSTVTATTDAPLCDILGALFPGASVTGAPKPRTMQIIADLETTPRRVYTGCVGFIGPERRAQFNVAIRTVLVDREKKQAEYGVGGGIVWDSVSRDEYEECEVKARVLTAKRPPFSLLETMLWTPKEGYFLLGYHLRRLCDSATYFGFRVDMDKIKERLASLAGSLPEEPQKVRLLVEEDGAVSCEASPLDGARSAEPVRLQLAATPIDSSNPFLYHKTTHRKVYEAARAGCGEGTDALLWNEKGEITETSIDNVVVQIEGELVTPPVECGLLPGTFRAWLLDQGRVREKVVTVEELRRSERISVVNSVRKWRKAAVNWVGSGSPVEG